MKLKVLVLDGSIYPDIYRPADHWRALLGPVEADAPHLPSGDPVPDVAGYSHLIVTGSEASIAQPEPWYDVEVEVVRRAFDLGLPILGSCFGHQLLAVALSGPGFARPSSTPELGWAPVQVLRNDPLLDGLPNPFHVFVSHFDEVWDPPAPWVVLARNERCAVHVMRYGDRPIWGIQAHPEITPADGRMLLEGFLDKAPDKAHLVRPALAQTPRDDGLAEAIVRRFLAQGS